MAKRWPMGFVRIEQTGERVEVYRRGSALAAPFVEELLCSLDIVALPASGCIPLEGDECPQIVAGMFVVIWADQQTVSRVYVF